MNIIDNKRNIWNNIEQLKITKIRGGEKQKSVNTLIDAIRARKGKKWLLSLAIENANKTANKLSGIDKTSHLSQIGTVEVNYQQ
jgi:hypothetical protein